MTELSALRGRLVTATCPKSMRWGPCGGVRAGGECELGGFRCPFLDRPVLAPELLVTGPPPLPWPVPWLLVDVRDESPDQVRAERAWTRTAEALRGAVALIGEHAEDADDLDDDSGRLPVEEVVAILGAAGVPSIVTITGRNRDRLRAAARLQRLAACGVAAIHAVTGDLPRPVSPASRVDWGIEGTSLAALAASMRIPVTVGESPAAPGDRQARLEVKRAHGASAVVLNHAGPTDALVAFADEHRRRCSADRHRPAPLPTVAPVPMVCDAEVAQRLARLPGVVLPPGLADLLRRCGPRSAVRLAADTVADLVGSGRFAGVDLSGDPGGRSSEERAERTGWFVAAALEALG